jgi:hypothetical protein
MQENKMIPTNRLKYLSGNSLLEIADIKYAKTKPGMRHYGH